MRIAIVKLSSLGDVVHALPVLHALRRHLPDAHLGWIVERREQAILEGHPELDELIPVDTRLWRREFRRPRGARTVFLKVRGLVRRLAASGFDAALDLQGLWKSGIITALTRAPLRIGFAAGFCRERASALFTNRRVRPPDPAAHVVEQNLALLAPLGVPVTEVAFRLPSPPGPAAAVARSLEAEGVKPRDLLVALNPGAGGDPKRWAVGAYRRVAAELAVRFGARVLLLWGPGEEPLARAIAHGMEPPPLIPPPTSLPELVALLGRAALVVGGDTGPIHIAAALGVPTLGLYGPTSGRRNGPYGARTLTIQSPTGRMEGISVEAVVAGAAALLRRAGA
ncbi:MAG: lipopolysaccharide heptosyltransferase I [Candidatus Rokubacteria bacterium]|nr:lipopolysaccharide heptosyltransferase I [Candidatus Rokubacteria bacterium]